MPEISNVAQRISTAPWYRWSALALTSVYYWPICLAKNLNCGRVCRVCLLLFWFVRLLWNLYLEQQMGLEMLRRLLHFGVWLVIGGGLQQYGMWYLGSSLAGFVG